MPAPLFFFQALAALGGELVEAGAAIGFGDAPLGFEQAAFGHAVERWIERAFFDAENFFRSLLDGTADGVTVTGAATKNFEDEDFESALEVICFGHERLT